MGDRARVTAFIAVGANIEPETHIEGALRALQQEVEVTGSSTFYRTPALDRPTQPDYLNGVWRIETDLPPRALKFDVLRPIENAQGRERSEDRYAPRTIDLDIAAYGGAQIQEPGLHIPDPDLLRRWFLSLPLLELAPGFRLPGQDVRLAEVGPARPEGEGTADTAFTARLRALLEQAEQTD